MSTSGNHVLDVFAREDSFTKRALTSGCVERIAFFDSVMAGLQYSRRPCVLRNYGYATDNKFERIMQKLAGASEAHADYDTHKLNKGHPLAKRLSSARLALSMQRIKCGVCMTGFDSKDAW